ncbi:hypothetical protein niasHT_024487 [Heterodera trifolii]|uniref:Uncharacterized protein n=1 Tax=Heterodera trifolii TaxID=157864 RepID=A0ABD2K759_9BILA
MGCCEPKVVAVISCLLNIFNAIDVFTGYGLQLTSFQLYSTGVFYLVLAFSCFAIIFARDNASLFLPFLVLKPVVLIKTLSYCIVYVTILLNGPSFIIHWALVITNSGRLLSLSEVNILVIVSLVMFLPLTVLFAWFYSIIFRAYVELAEKSAPDNANSEGYGDVAAGSEGYDDVAAGPTCCCGPCRARIETAIPVVALVGFFFLLSEASDTYTFFYSNCKNDNDNFCIVYVIYCSLCLAAAIVYLVVVFAQRERNPSLFLPYLFIMPVILIIHLLDIALLLFIIIRGLGSSDPRVYEGLHLIIGFLFEIFIFTVLHIWFYSLICRAYKKIKQHKSASFIANSSSQAEESRVGP